MLHRHSLRCPVNKKNQGTELCFIQWHWSHFWLILTSLNLFYTMTFISCLAHLSHSALIHSMNDLHFLLIQAHSHWFIQWPWSHFLLTPTHLALPYSMTPILLLTYPINKFCFQQWHWLPFSSPYLTKLWFYMKSLISLSGHPMSRTWTNTSV